jgi:hypothetical protein
MLEEQQNNQAIEITENSVNTPATSSKESNENDIQMKAEPSAFKENDQIASEKMRYPNADKIYPE